MKRILFLSDLGLSPLWVETIKPFIPEGYEFEVIGFPEVETKNLPAFEVRQNLLRQLETKFVENNESTLFVHGLGVPLIIDYLQKNSQNFLKHFNSLIIYPKLNPTFKSNDFFRFEALEGLVGTVTNLKLRKIISGYLNNNNGSQSLKTLLSENVEYRATLRLYEQGWESLLPQHNIEVSIILSTEDNPDTNQLMRLCKRSFKSVIIRRTPEWGYLPMLESPGDFAEEVCMLSTNFSLH